MPNSPAPDEDSGDLRDLLQRLGAAGIGADTDELVSRIQDQLDGRMPPG